MKTKSFGFLYKSVISFENALRRTNVVQLIKYTLYTKDKQLGIKNILLWPCIKIHTLYKNHIHTIKKKILRNIRIKMGVVV